MKVLIYAEAWGNGGIESFIKNELRCLASQKNISFDLFSVWTYNSPGIELNICGLNKAVSVFCGRKPNLIVRSIRGAFSFYKLLKSEQYDCVHVNTMNGMGLIYAWLARLANVRVRLVHSHNSDFGNGFRGIKSVVHAAGKLLWGSSATIRIACSKKAGEYLFGDHPFTVINNGIDTSKYCFSREKREFIRNQFSVEDHTLLVGSIGRISEQKNPIFQLEVFSSLLRKTNDAVFLVVGDGDMRTMCEEKAEELGLSSKVHFVGAVDDTSGYYSALDCMVMPSLFEGLPLALVEAQCEGLHVVCSETISSEGIFTGLVRQLSLESNPEIWARAVLDIDSNVSFRTHFDQATIDAGFSDREVAKTLLNLYGLDGGC